MLCRGGQAGPDDSQRSPAWDQSSDHAAVSYLIARATAPAVVVALILSINELPSAQPRADPLAAGFGNPPDSARPRTWWHWTMSNVTKEGITEDLEWMKRVGIGGFMLADVNAGADRRSTKICTSARRSGLMRSATRRPRRTRFSFLFEYEHVPTPAVPPETTVPPRNVIDLTSKMTPDGTLVWEAPAGTWTVLGLGYSLSGAKNRPATPAGSGFEADKLSREHIQAYYRGYFGPLQKALGPLFGPFLPIGPVVGARPANHLARTVIIPFG